MKELRINDRSYSLKDGYNILSCEVTDQKHNTVVIPGLSIKHAVILLQNNNCQLMDLLSDGGITIDSQILEPLKWGALQDNVMIKMGAIFARFSNQPDDDNDIVRASPEDSFFASRFKHSQNIEISCIPDTDVLDETAISKTSSVEELSKTFIPETERYTERSTENYEFNDSDSMELPAESQSLFSPGRNPVDNLIASFSQPDSDDEELAQMNELGLNQDLKVPSNRENSLTPEFLELPERTPNHDKSFLNASTNGNDKERSVTPELDLPSTSTLDISSNEAKCSKTPRQEFSFAIPSSIIKPVSKMKDSQKDILTQHLILKEDPQEDILTQKYVEDDPFECATQALDVGSLKLPTRVTRIKSEFEKKTKRAMPVVKPYIDWTSYDQATQPYQEELTSTQIISKQRVFDLDTEPCFFETPINGQQTNKIQPKKRLQILRTPSPELYNDRSIARSPDLRDESLDDAYCLNPTIVLESEKRKSSKKLISHEINAKIDARNQIFCSSDDESDDERFNKSDTPKTPKRIRNITLRLSQEKDTPEFLKGLSSHSQLENALVEANLSQAADERIADFNELSDVEEVEQERLEVEQIELRKKKTDEIIIMKYEKVDDKDVKKTKEPKPSTSRRRSVNKAEPQVPSTSRRRSVNKAEPEVPSKSLKSSKNKESVAEKKLGRPKKKEPEAGPSKPTRKFSEDTEQEVRKGSRKRVSKYDDIYDTSLIDKDPVRYKSSVKDSKKVVEKIESKSQSARAKEDKVELDGSLISKRTRSKNVDPKENKKQSAKRPAPNEDPDFIPKRTRQEENSTNSSRLKVCLSNLHEHTEISKTYIRDLGGIVMKDVIAADILMTSDAVNLTVKVLGAIMLGLPIVTYKWLSMSVAEGEFAEPSEYIMRDKAHEHKHNYSMKNIIQRSQNHKLFRGYSIFVTSDTMPPLHEMKFLIELGLGECLNYKMSPKYHKMFVVGENEMEIREVKKRFVNISVITPSHFLTKCLLQQKIDFMTARH